MQKIWKVKASYKRCKHFLRRNEYPLKVEIKRLVKTGGKPSSEDERYFTRVFVFSSSSFGRETSADQNKKNSITPFAFPTPLNANRSRSDSADRTISKQQSLEIAEILGKRSESVIQIPKMIFKYTLFQ